MIFKNGTYTRTAYSDIKNIHQNQTYFLERTSNSGTLVFIVAYLNEGDAIPIQDFIFNEDRWELDHSSFNNELERLLK